MKSNKLHRRIFITLSLISSLLIMFFSVIISIFIKRTYENNIYNKLKFESEKIAYEINKELEVKLETINELSLSLSSVADPTNKNKIDRLQAISLLEKTIQENDNILELYSVWEKNLFDNKDSLFVNIPGSDSIGRFCPQWIKDNEGKIVFQTYNTNENEYYESSTELLNETVLNPFTVRKSAKKVLKLPLISPVFYGNKFLGIIGINISTDWLQFYLDARNSANQQIAIINNEGTIIGLSNDKAYRGKFLTELILEKQDEIFFDIKSGVAFDYKTDNYIIIGTPFYIGDTNKSWHSVILYPKYKFKIYSFLIIFSLILGGILLSVVVTVIFRNLLRKLLIPVSNIGNIVAKLENGHIFENINLKNDSLLNINDGLNKIKDNYIEISDVCKNIVNENYNTTLKPRNENDLVRNSINSIIEKLKKDKIKLQEKEEADRISGWVKNGVTLLNESIRLHSSSISELSDVIVSTLSKYMDALLCGFFMYYDNSEEDKYLEVVSTYAYDIKKSFSKKIYLNEGFIGTCAVERKKIYITKVPDDYIFVSSGLGESTPKSILILPLEFENEFIGVLEIAFFRVLKQYEIDFAESVVVSLASAIKSVKINLITTELLEKSRKQTDELAYKETELLENLERHKKMQLQFEKHEAELKGLLNAVNNSTLTLEYTPEGILLSANDKFLKTMSYTLEEIKGVNVLDLVSNERDELKKVIDTVSRGNSVEKLMKRFTKFGEIRWLYSYYTPYFESRANVTKILYFAFDVTDRIQQNAELENINKMIKEELEITKMKLKQFELENNKTEN